jgi:Mg2+ and Co2+ transporter CorA
MHVFHVAAEAFAELDGLPETLPAGDWLWIATTRREFEVQAGTLQAALSRWTGAALFEPHVADLLNNQLPSHYDYTSWYDVLVFRRLAAGGGTAAMFADETQGTLSTARQALHAIDTSPVGFAVFDRVLITVHPTGCQVLAYFIERLKGQAQGADQRGGGRLPTSPADLMLRMVNHMVDSYLDLRRLLTRQLGYLQQALFSPHSRYDTWEVLLESRNTLHLLEDTCEDQRSAIVEWIDALGEWPEPPGPAERRERELLRVRSRDVLEHIERVLTHVRRLESSSEAAVQMYFAAQSNRTNAIMRTLTVVTAVFLPLNLVTGFFGMNFEALPLIHSARGFWVAFGLMLLLGIGASMYFWRKRYLGTHP